MIPVTPRIQLDERELEETFIRASGPGGQNVNKVASKVELRVDLDRIEGLRDDARARLDPYEQAELRKKDEALKAATPAGGTVTATTPAASDVQSRPRRVNDP